MTPGSIMRGVRDPLRLHLNQKDLKSGKKQPSYGQFTNGRMLTPVSIVWHVWDLFGLHLNQKDLKSGKKRLIYGQFTNGRLGDSSEHRVGCLGFIWASFEPKISKIGQEMAELWPIYQREVA